MNSATCKSCGASVEWPAKTCPQCGKSVKAFKNLVGCRSCGNPVAKDANKCPCCGTRNPNKSALVARVIAAIVFLVFFTSCVSSLSNTDNNTDTPAANSVEETPEYIEVDAVALWEAYQENEVKADLLYGDKLLAVTGTIIDIGKDIVTEAPCVSLDSGGAYNLYPIQCFFPKNGGQTDLLASLSDGDVVTIYGTCTGEFVATVQLSGCFLANE